MAGLPVILGPGFYFLAARAPAPFVAQAASYALLSLCATHLFLLACIAVAVKAQPMAALFCAMTTWLLAAVLFQLFPARPMIDVLLFIVANGICLRLGTRFVAHASPAKGKAGLGLLSVRCVLAGTLVAVVTTASHWLGSTGVGLLLAFPIGYSVVAVTIHQKFGLASVTATLYSALFGTARLPGFCTALALAIQRWAPHVALGIALATSSRQRRLH